MRVIIVDAMEEIEHQKKCGVVEHGAGRADEKHEFLDALDVPFARLVKVFLVHAVGGNAELGEVIEEIVDEHLDRRHRQERQKDRSAHHAEHVAEVGARAHLDVFDDVAEDLAAFDDAVLQHEQAFFQENDVRGFLGDVDGGIHGNADVRRLHGGGVVDPVAQKADHVAVALQGADDLFFLGGREPREHSCFFSQRGQLLVV